MVKVNRHLLPIKAHYFFFMAAMGPILPQLSVYGKQLGVSPDVMGYITSVLPIMYVIAKPIVGYVADYFSHFRKFIFSLLILLMTLSYAAFYFVPPAAPHAIDLDVTDVWNVSFAAVDLTNCSSEILTPAALCSASRPARCSIDSANYTDFVAYFMATATAAAQQFNLSSNVWAPSKTYMCLTQANYNITSDFADTNNITCHFAPELQTDCIYGNSTFWLFVVFLCLGTIGFNVVNSISDAICFDMLGESEEGKYGAQRVWGTIGFGATALLAGIAVNLWTTEALKSFTPAVIVMLIFSGFDLLSVSKLKLPKLSSSESIFKDVWKLVSHPAIAIFLVFATIAGIIDSFIIYFMFWHVEEVAAETGFMSQIKLIEGCVVAAECLAGEVPFFFYSGKIIKKLGYVHCMTMCFFFYALRLALIAWIPNPWYLVGVELFFQGSTYALCYTCIVAYASAVAPPGTSATVQGLMAGMDDGLGFSIGSLVGGLVFKHFGGRRSFFYFAIFAFTACVLHMLVRPRSRKRQYLPKSGYQVPNEQVTLGALATEQEIKA
ncbi:major facilitator superfamily domain-containing protein 6 [Zeugodacus cucurbitae]|uniref:Major facilitator superfamily domain-containing protein 6 n=1 Tax=Zeugodacus cucurbitae TaxID=28588 RepID=A0A0A1XC57_ZEUCU|nr:major facilitator superfamily domain-containing protein 6 [Zeugodacus cucurbitae]XP_011185407.2 major facilitator superfamily domain-containing protein 6 [Zeugodacus cucurbitae]XP_011185408.2 major facilitator superfamily domain-containing protein 6 [Zeugodacus cucurbitae]XP_011185409.2 major facilitator superfamily domain-containing protein 6 [Zeugodacus cucurbitae]XP_011185411.2 major facilitator superfamily domain-containing protein 6 [Zeugodacus cucurbitae]XP_028897332.2 major facilitat